MSTPLLECVPNVSEGRSRAVVDRLAHAVTQVRDVRLASVHMDPDHHRSVLTFLGPPRPVQAAALALARAVFETVDMRAHQGIHPRLGALDVLPFVPLRDLTMTDAVGVARTVAERLAVDHQLPVYLYGAAASAPERRSLLAVRAGQYEGLPTRLADPSWRPDFGPARFEPRLGALLVGAREILVAYNVWLDTDDPAAARVIARAVRESAGGLPALQAMGGLLERRGIAQVAMNLLDYRVTPLPRAFDAVRTEAAKRGVGVRRGELVGLAPRAAFAGRSPESVGLVDWSDASYLDSYL
ncbi:MAG TPA: glutamate formimidoyltransferase [Candidatus Dormibacteraeota bacterium]|nr:glutamate formimidoyltransferase [Candidatus Dormibacteraeota bacterium]